MMSAAHCDELLYLTIIGMKVYNNNFNAIHVLCSEQFQVGKDKKGHIFIS